MVTTIMLMLTVLVCRIALWWINHALNVCCTSYFSQSCTSVKPMNVSALVKDR